MGQLAYGFPKNSPYLPIINFFIKDLRDYGILQRHTYKYLSKRPIQCDTQAETKPIGKLTKYLPFIEHKKLSMNIIMFDIFVVS